jgi:hypothetical protein
MWMRTVMPAATVAVVACAAVVTAQSVPPRGTTVTAPIWLPPLAPDSSRDHSVDGQGAPWHMSQDQTMPGSAQKPGTVAPSGRTGSPFPGKPDYAWQMSSVNVRVEATITDQSGSGTPTKKTISVTVADRGQGSVRSGVTVPIVTTTFTPTPQRDVSTPPMSSYSYRDMGLNLDVGNVYVEGDSIRVRLSVEYNPVDEKVADAPVGSTTPAMPSFNSFKQSLNLALQDGKALVVAQSSDPVPARDRKMTLEVKATILR